MTDRRIRIVLFAAVFLVVLVAYLASVAPTASFWDCGELIATACIYGVPHPPGTPLFVTIGRIFSMLPASREYAFRINLIPVLFGAFSCGLIYLLVIKLISLYANPERRYDKWLPHVAGFFGALACAFAFSFWDNSVEAEVYGPCVVVALSVLYMALVWRDQLERAGGDNRLMLGAIYLLFLSTGIHFTPMMTVFAVLVFAMVVDRDSVLSLRIFELVAGYLIILTMAEMGFSLGTFIAVPLMLGATWYGIRVMERSTHTRTVFYGLGLFFLVFVVAYVAAGNNVMDDTVLFLASPTVAFIERWVRSPALLVLFVVGYGGYLYWLHRQGKLRPKYVALMLGLLLLAGSVQFIMYTRASKNPSINEVNPSNWRDFVSVLKREQYDPMKLLPRKTQFLTEDDWRLNRNPRFGVLTAYYEQVKFYVRYFFWQWGNPRFFDIFLNISWQALFGLVAPLLGLWGMWHQFRKEKRSFTLILVAFLVASIGLVTYLNLKYSPSDPRHGDPAQGKLGYLEVRERDYFFAFSFVFYAIFVGVGAYAFLRWFADKCMRRSTSTSTSTLPYVMSGALLAVGFVPMLLNYKSVTRRGDWIPAEYGYNMLVSCPGERAVVFTNGDNDTFPLWFIQAVPSRVSGYDPNFGKNVAVANLSLLNTNWYCKQLKRWGAPISFTESQLDRLPQGFVGKDNRTYLLKDVMMRDIIATSAGVKLKWPDDYGCTPEEFRAKVFTPNYTPRTPVYYATTVSRDNLEDVGQHLRLEGLVDRVVREDAPDQVDIGRTRHYLYDVYVMKSMLDPRVEKDENTRGLLINYAASYLGLASEYQKANRNSEALEVIEKAMSFDLEPARRAPLYFHASMFAMLLGQYAKSIAYLDSIEAKGYQDPELSLRRAYAYQAMGDFAHAEAAYHAAIAGDPTRSEPIQALVRMYLDDVHDTGQARAVMQQWLKRAPADSAASKLLREIS